MLKSRYQERKAILQQAKNNATYVSGLAALRARLLEAEREAYGRATCSWGTRNKNKQAVEQAMTTTHPRTGKRIPRSPDNPPKPREWDGSGLAAVQIQATRN